MKNYFLLLTLLFVGFSGFCQIFGVNKYRPVLRNDAYFSSTGELRWQTIFSKEILFGDTTEKLGQNILDVIVEGTVFSVNNFGTNFKIGLDSTNEKTYENFISLGRGGNSYVLRKGESWDKVEATVSYIVENERYTLPPVTFYNYKNESNKIPSKISIHESGLLLPNKKGRVTLEIGGRELIKLTSIEVKDLQNNILKKLQGDDLRDYANVIGKFHLIISNIEKDEIKLRVNGDVQGKDISDEKLITLKKQVKILSIEGDDSIDLTKPYGLNLFDKSSNEYKVILSSDDAILKVKALSDNHSASLEQDQKNKYRYKLKIISKKIIFEDNVKLLFSSEDSPLEGVWYAYRPQVIPEIHISQKKKNGVHFTFKLPSWIKGDLDVHILETKNDQAKTTKTIINKKSDLSSDKQFKKFELSLDKSDFDGKYDEKKDSIFSGAIIVKISGKSIMAQRFNFLNLDFYIKKIEEIKKSDKGKTAKKEAIKGVLASLFDKTGETANESTFKSIVKNLSSKKATDNEKGKDQIIDTVVKLAPLLIMLI